MTVALARIRRLVPIVAVLAAFAAPVAAQLIDVPPFTALDATQDVHYGNFHMAGGANASLMVATGTWGRDINKMKLIAQRFSASGASAGAPLFPDDDTATSLGTVFADGRGGYVMLWDRNIGDPLVARLIDAAGTPTTPPFIVTWGFTFEHQAIGLAGSFVVVWGDYTSVKFRMYDPAGQPLGTDPVSIPVTPFALYNLGAAALADGGFVVVWQVAHDVRAQKFDASGAPVGGVIDVTDEFDLWDAAASPLGGFAVVGIRHADTHALPAGIWARRFDDGGAPSGPGFLVDFFHQQYVLAFPQATYDTGGRLYVTWYTTSSTLFPARGRVYDPSGRPLQGSFTLTDEDASGVVVAARSDGCIAEGWRANSDFRLQVRELCGPPFHTSCGDGVVEAPCEKCDLGAGNSDTTPDTCRTTCALPSCGDGVVDHNEQCDDGNQRGCDGCDADCNLEPGWVCGDGVVSTDCAEECDDGPGNDDTLPNACRTDCRCAHCGDGVLDDGEGCDDGNLTSCDGCSDRCVPEPGLVCGDGIPEVLCGEQCDDGNTIVGDGCSGPCELERIAGGGSPVTDCQAEWVVDNPSNAPRYDTRGGFNGVQTCRDGDPACDFDSVAGTCTFHVRVCANNTDHPECLRGTRLRSWELKAPSAAKAAAHPALAAVRAAFAGVPGAIVGPQRPDVCSDVLDVPIAVRANASGVKAGSVVLKSLATLYTGTKDADKLKLICVP